METEILDSEIVSGTVRRRKLLPTWIKIFLWMFMIFGIVVPAGLVLGMLGYDFDISLYGIETQKTLSLTGLFLLALFALKGTVSFGLWTEKDWAIKLAIVDALIGIVVCSIVMLALPIFAKSSGFNFSLRLELILLIPYLLKMQKIKTEWEERRPI